MIRGQWQRRGKNKLSKRKMGAGGRRTWRLEALEGRTLLTATPYLVTSASGDPSVVGSLPYEVGLANTQTPNPDGSDITFDSSVFTAATTIDLLETLTLSQSVGPEVIDGTGAGPITVSGGNSFGVIQLNSGTTATITDLTISNGSATNGGGINNSGTLTLSDVTLFMNTAADGGGIYNAGTLTITGGEIPQNSATDNGGGIFNDGGDVKISDSCTIVRNFASSLGGGIYQSGGTVTITGAFFAKDVASGDGGGIYVSDGTLTITGSTLAANSAPSGGAIFNFGGDVKISGGCSITGNSAGSKGGGLDQSGGTVAITGSTLANNAAIYGAGIYVSDGSLTLTSSVLSSNSATAYGGGIDNIDGDLTISGGTISKNLAKFGAGIDNELGGVKVNDDCSITGNDASSSGGGIHQSGGIVTISGSTISGNTAGDNGGGIYLVDGSLTITGGSVTGNSATGNGAGIYNLDGDVKISGSCSVAGNIASDAGGGIYQSEGTVTIAGSTVANNTAENGGGVFVNGGLLTITGGSVSGNSAFEDGGGIYNDSGTVNISGACSINGNFASDSGGGIHQSGGTLAISGSTISGNTAGSGGGVFVRGGSLTITGGSVSGNKAFEDGGGIYDEFGPVQISAGCSIASNSAGDNGGGFYGSAGAFAINGSMVSGNTANDGGGVFVHGGSLTITGGTFSGNKATENGGGINESGGQVKVSGSCSITSNSAGTRGGGIYESGGTVTITGSTIARNTALDGGGVCVGGGSLTISGGALTGNSATDDGGGIADVSGGHVKVSGSCNISGNSAGSAGGGIYEGDGGTVTITKSTLKNNTATNGGSVYVAGGSLTITASTLSGNTARDSGGALYETSGTSGPFPTLINDTISGNTASNFGGGIYVSGGVLDTINVTIAYNSAGIAGGGIDQTGGTVELYNTIVALNTAPTDGDIAGTVSGSYNLIGVGGSGGLVNTDGNQVGVADPGLGVLGNYGGPTETIPLLPGSPALGKGSSDIPGVTVPTVDQRGVPRPANFIDVGAFQLNFTLTGSAGNEVAGVEGSSTPVTAPNTVGTLLGTFVDSNLSATAADYTVVVNWGDGTALETLSASNLTVVATGTPLGTEYAIYASHTYAEEGTYAYSISVTDDIWGGSTIVSGSAIVADALLEADTPLTETGNTGVPLTSLVLPGRDLVGSFTDGNAGAPTTDFTGTIDWGDGSPESVATFVPVGGGIFDVYGSHTYATPSVTLSDPTGVYNVKTIVNDVGGSTVTLTATYTITDLAVSGSVKNFTATEGENTGTIVLASFEDPNTLATVANVTAFLPAGGWGDATPTGDVTLSVQQIGVDPSNGDPIFEVLGSHTYTEEGSYTVNIDVTTSGGVTTALTSGTATVLDAPLTGSAGTEITGVEGNSTGTELLGTFVDANQAATVADYSSGGGSVVVNWGDGSALQTLLPGDIIPVGTPKGVVWTIYAAHTYTEEGTYAYTVTVTDDGGASTIVSGSAIVADAALSADATTALNEKTGVSFTGVIGTFTDANPDGSAADFTASISWGNGSPPTAGTITELSSTATSITYEVIGTYTYATFGTYDPSIVVKDDGGSQITLVTSPAPGGAAVINVTDTAITGAASSFSAVEGINTGTIVLGTFTYADPNATVGSVSAFLPIGGWGDGSPSSQTFVTVQQMGANATESIFEILGSHTYLEEAASLALNISVETPDGTITPLTPGVVTVLDAPLTSSNGPEVEGIEGSLTPVTAPSAVGTLLGSFTDANQHATIDDYLPVSAGGNGGSVVVNWGDGSALQTLGVDNLTLNGSPDGVTFTVNVSHDYVEEGTYSYTVTVTDDGGSVTSFTGSAITADAPLAAAATQPTVTQDSPTIYPLPAFAPPLLDNVPVAYFTDANPLPPTGSSSIADFTASINWGDGTPDSTGTIVLLPGGTASFEVLGSHTYATNGVTNADGHPTIQVFIVDDGGSRLTVSNDNVTVIYNPLSVTGAINPTSVSGLSTGTPNVTNVDQPNFSGTVLAATPAGTTPEAYAEVTLTAINTTTGASYGIGSVQAGSGGQWSLTSSVALPDGYYTVTATAVDQFGVDSTVTPGVIDTNLLIDTKGPVITSMFWNRLNGQIDYTIQDPGAAPSGVWLNTLVDSSNYLFTKVHANKAYPGKYVVTNVSATHGSTPDSYNVVVTINGGTSIRGGFYLFTIRDSSNGNSSVQDLAENHLDGVFYGTFPSGNGINGSDFVAELSGYHNKIFAPQTIVGTSSAANGGNGGRREGEVHSGHFTPIVRRTHRLIAGAESKGAKKADLIARRSIKVRTDVSNPLGHSDASTNVHDVAIMALTGDTSSTTKKK